MADIRAGAVDLSHLLDESKWNAYQKWLILLTALVIVFDGIDNQLLGVSIPTIMQDFGVARSAFAPVAALGFVGMMIGGATAGLAGDRFGRRSALLGCMGIFGVATLASAFVADTQSLGLLRLLAGVGLGGAMPNAATLAAEYVPKARRPLAVTITIVCVPLGATLAGVLASYFLPRAGWRFLFMAGGVVPLLAAVLLWKLLPESPRYLARHASRRSELIRLLRRMGHDLPDDAQVVDTSEQPSVAARTPVSALFGPGLRRDTLALWVSFLSCLLAVYLGFNWLPSLLSSSGFGPSAASNGITAFNLGGVIGAILGGLAFSKIGSRSAMLLMTAAAIGGAVVLATMQIDPNVPWLPLFAMLTLTGGLINAVQTTMYALATHVYPSASRATGVGLAAGLGRSGAILSGYAGPWALDYRGSTSYFGLMAGAMLVCFAALSLIRRHVPATRTQAS